jgi:murein DD-endopeptidase MepM/ murein hydrolase activator NlpD
LAKPRRRRQPNDIQIIRRTLRRAGDPQWKYAKDLARASKISGRPWQLIAAIAQAESSGGRYTPSNAPYNLWGWSVNTGQNYSSITGPFQNPHTAYTAFAKGLRKNYRGGNSINDPVWEKFAASPAWQGNVSSFLRKYGVNPNQIGGSNVRGVQNPGGRRAPQAGGADPVKKRMRGFVAEALAMGMSPSELLPVALMMEKQMGGLGGGGGGRQPARRGRGNQNPATGYGPPVIKKFTMGGGPDAHGSRPLGNWQSDHAWDLMAPPGTPVYAIADGRISPSAGFGFHSNGSTVWGRRFTLEFKGNAAFYTHLGRYAKGIKPGARVKKGQLLGYLGDPPGFPSHLHIGLMHGDLMDYMRR